MKALVLYYAYDGVSTQADPIAIMPQMVWENVTADEQARMFERVREDYKAPEEHCREAWVNMPDGDGLFETPDLGDARMGKAR